LAALKDMPKTILMAKTVSSQHFNRDFFRFHGDFLMGIDETSRRDFSRGIDEKKMGFMGIVVI
jgi:hypothetical protein